MTEIANQTEDDSVAPYEAFNVNNEVVVFYFHFTFTIRVPCIYFLLFFHTRTVAEVMKFRLGKVYLYRTGHFGSDASRNLPKKG